MPDPPSAQPDPAVPTHSFPVIGLVGPCTAGKSTLAYALRARGYIVRHIAQEHSYVPDMWQRISHPDLLIYLHVSYPTSLTRRSQPWTEREYAEQLRRLAHARTHADLLIDTDSLSPAAVLAAVLASLAP